jgi:hypothetical protein
MPNIDERDDQVLDVEDEAPPGPAPTYSASRRVALGNPDSEADEAERLLEAAFRDELVQEPPLPD